jgi:dCMP deaminase
MDIASLVATRSTCLRRQVGAVIVKDKHILTTGYNGAPTGLPHCLDIGCMRDDLHIPSGTQHELCRAVHAEQNAICQAAQHGISLLDSTLYCTHQPCSICAKLIVNVGIKKIFYIHGYPDDMTKDLLGDKLNEYK